MKRDFFWNTLGSVVYALSMPVLVIIVTHLQGTGEAGMFSIAFISAQMFMVLGNYAVRVFQVSDIEEKYNFKEYCSHRLLTCLLMVGISGVYTWCKNYSGDMFWLCVVLCLYKALDAYADVYEGELQKKGFLYKAGIAIFTRVIISIVVFTILLLITRNLLYSAIFMTLAAFLLVIALVVFPTRKRISEGTNQINKHNIRKIFTQCFPLFISLFLIGYINNSPKYALENHMAYEYQTYFNAIYFPAQVIYMLTGFIFKPLLVKMSKYWEERNLQLFILVKRIYFIIFVFSVMGMVVMALIGIPILSFVFGLNMTGYKWKAVVMLAAGGALAVINFMYHVLTVMRKHNFMIFAYAATFAGSLLLPEIMVDYWGIWGAVWGYLILLLLLACLLNCKYIATIKHDRLIP